MMIKTFRFDMHTTIFERDWGFLVGEISKYKFDFLPRLTITTTKHMMEINIGIFCFHMWLTIFSNEIQEFNRRTREFSRQ